MKPVSGDSGPQPVTRTTAAGVGFDLYEPAGPPRRTCLAVHGATLAGKEDGRLKSFARCLAASGVRAAVPDLRGLKSCVFSEGDVLAIADLAASLGSEYGKPVAMAGFSFGAGLSLVAAAKEELAGFVDPILCFGAHHSMDGLWALHLPETRPPRTEAEWHDHIYLRLALAYPVMDRLGLSREDKAVIADALGSYCADPSVEAKRRAYALVERRSLAELYELGVDPKVNNALSPAGKLGRLRSRVILLHDANDRLIPPDHSRRLFDELKPGGRASLLVTPLLSHVAPGSIPRGLADILPLLRMVGAVVG
ncbi:MAG: alpha/beta hydrolase [Elusimicrobia bacterium]|nr:alpha/beta hydrolase [Elusimicrobiota bacterium]